MGDVPDFVAEDRRHLEGRHGLDQGVGQEHIPKSGQDPGDAGIEHRMAGIPDQDVGEPEADSLRGALQPATKWPRAPGVASARPA